MYIEADDAKTDVILAGAVAVLGTSLRGFVMQLPMYPTMTILGQILEVAWIVALSALVPFLLASYRGDRSRAFGWHGLNGIGSGMLVAVPIIAAALLAQWIATGQSLSGVLLGRLIPTVADGTGAFAGMLVDPAMLVIIAVNLLQVIAYTLGVLLLPGFLAVRAREGFSRSPEMHLTQLIRTVGLGAFGVALIGGLLSAIGAGAQGYLAAVINAVALAGVLLLADRLIPAGITVARAAIIGPVVVVTIGKIFLSGGIFGNLLGGFTSAALALGMTLAIAGLAQTRRGIAAAVPAAIAVAWWPTCLSPLGFGSGIC